MIKKIIILLAIVGPFITYFFYLWVLKAKSKKYPITKLSIISILLLISALVFLRFYENYDPNTKYKPAQYQDGKIKPAENK